MSIKSNIQWTDATWNIARGCTKVDEDCKFCYMYRESLNDTRYNPKEIKKTKTVFNLPLKLKEPSKIFTSSLTDFFHPECDAFRDEAWKIIRKCPQHTFQILTKRPERINECLPKDWGKGYDNVWLGTSVGSQKSQKRIIDLLYVPAKIHFLSLEPLYEKVSINEITFYTENSTEKHFPLLGINTVRTSSTGMFIQGKAYANFALIDWVIVGGESGNDVGKYRYRECKLEWIESIVEQCKKANIPVFVKQLGTYLAKTMQLKDRHGGEIDEFPENLKVRQFPVKEYLFKQQP